MSETIQKHLEDYLHGFMMWPDEIGVLFDGVSGALGPILGKSADGYPPATLRAARMELRALAIEYLKEKDPNRLDLSGLEAS
jgi:hypothetical protein